MCFYPKGTCQSCVQKIIDCFAINRSARSPGSYNFSSFYVPFKYVYRIGYEKIIKLRRFIARDPFVYSEFPDPIASQFAGVYRVLNCCQLSFFFFFLPGTERKRKISQVHIPYLNYGKLRLACAWSTRYVVYGHRSLRPGRPFFIR